MILISKLKGLLRSKLGRDHVVYDGLVLPTPETRYGGDHFKSNEAFLESGRREVKRLVERCRLSPQSRLLEVGCGRGRLPIAVIAQKAGIRSYTGLDVDKRSIDWCQKHIGATHPSFTFVHIDLANERYNPDGITVGPDLSLPFPDDHFEIIYLYSVFSHLEEKDVRLYLREFKRLLTAGGSIFLTAFVQEGVPPMAVNPVGYVMDWSGPLHCVRYETNFLRSLFAEAGFIVERMEYETETDKQSAFYLRS